MSIRHNKHMTLTRMRCKNLRSLKIYTSDAVCPTRAHRPACIAVHQICAVLCGAKGARRALKQMQVGKSYVSVCKDTELLSAKLTEEQVRSQPRASE